MEVPRITVKQILSPFTVTDDNTEHLTAAGAEINTICFNMFIKVQVFKEQGDMHCDNQWKTSLN